MSRSQTTRAARRAARELEPGKRKPPYHVGFRWDYENARRAGKTQPDKVEIIEVTDPRHRNFPKPQPVNRASKRAGGVRGAGQATAIRSSRRRPVTRCAERLPYEDTGVIVRCSRRPHADDQHIGRVLLRDDNGVLRSNAFTWRHDAKAGLQLQMLKVAA